MRKRKTLGLDEIIRDDGDPDVWRALAGTTTKATGTSLTMESFQKMFDYFQSDEYHQKEIEKRRRIALGTHLLNTAMMENVINEFEWIRLTSAMGINGGLLVSSKMYERLRPLIDRMEKEYGDSEA